MDVSCEQRGCCKMLDLHDEACYCARCDSYYCEKHYELWHEKHDTEHAQPPKCLEVLRR